MIKLILICGLISFPLSFNTLRVLKSKVLSLKTEIYIAGYVGANCQSSLNETTCCFLIRRNSLSLCSMRSETLSFCALKVVLVAHKGYGTHTVCLLWMYNQPKLLLVFTLIRIHVPFIVNQSFVCTDV